jgi:Cu2+-exporting ATPase
MDNFIAEVLPHQKLEKIKDLQTKGESFAMTGDGVNDAACIGSGRCWYCCWKWE